MSLEETGLPLDHYREIIDAVGEGLMVVRADGTIVMANTAMTVITGKSREELLGSTCTVLNCDACEILRSEVDDKWCMLFEKGQVKGKRCHLIRKDGSYASVIKNARLLTDGNGNVLGALETFADVSEIDRRDHEIHELKSLLGDKQGFFGMVGESAVMKKAFSVLEKAALYDSPVLIHGERGVGKKLAARLIHDVGRRRQGAFIQLNCAALSAAHMGSELFGHTRGAFDGARRHYKGHFENANGGDIFLDEIAEIPLDDQAKILDLIETRRIKRIGDLRSIPVDVRIIAATSHPPQQLISRKQLRQDLFLRLNVVPVRLPALRERMEDIPLLTRNFADHFRAKSGKNIVAVSGEVMKRFMDYRWPGNVRELRNTLEYAFIVAEGRTIEIHDLPSHFSAAAKAPPARSQAEVVACNDRDVEEKKALVKALRASRGNKTKAAGMLGVHRMTVWNRMRKYGIQIQRNVE